MREERMCVRGEGERERRGWEGRGSGCQTVAPLNASVASVLAVGSSDWHLSISAANCLRA